MKYGDNWRNLFAAKKYVFTPQEVNAFETYNTSGIAEINADTARNFRRLLEQQGHNDFEEMGPAWKAEWMWYFDRWYLSDIGNMFA